MERHEKENVVHNKGDIASKQNVIPAERFFKKLPTLVIAGDEQSVDRIAYELMKKSFC